jgi:hypothetical protein
MAISLGTKLDIINQADSGEKQVKWLKKQYYRIQQLQQL